MYLAKSKICRKCGKMGEFHRNKNGKDGLREICKNCVLDYEHSPAGKAIRAKINARYNSRPESKLALGLRNRLRLAIKNGQKAGSAVGDLGCTIPEFRAHIEGLFKPGMTWENWGKHGWHLDHIKPLSKFDLTDRAQFLQASHYTNLQPLWATENWSKAAK